MKVGAVDISNVPLPPEDGAMARALADLECKLTAWTAAVADVQDKLATRAAQLTEAPLAMGSPSETGSAAVEVEPATSRAETPSGVVAQAEEADAAAGVEANAPHEEVITTAVAVDEQQPVVGSADAIDAAKPDVGVSEEDEALLSPLEPELAKEIRAQHRLLNGRKSVQQLIVEQDEALLGSLEPETAKAIRVQHRLFNGRKSVRQLIEEYKPETKHQKESWWRRAKK